VACDRLLALGAELVDSDEHRVGVAVGDELDHPLGVAARGPLMPQLTTAA
jgi:hypothetical protein